MAGLIFLAIIVFFFYVCYDNIRFWADALFRKHVPQLWWLPWIVLPAWLFVMIFAIFLIISPPAL